jgi:hypothetical protein
MRSQATTKARRGNLLLSALFMAAFLFFLSVALVVTNREDIRYTLFVDHKMRASLAAEGMLDYALDTMRNHSDWEGRINSWQPGFASGARGSVQTRFWSTTPLPENLSRYSLPQNGEALAGVELIATASSGPFRSERHMLLEEFRFADSLLAQGGKPHLFALTGNNVQVLTPSFVWEPVGVTPCQPLPNTLSAGGESLHFLAQGQGTKPPQIQDFSKNVQGDLIMADPNLAPTVQQIPVGHGGSVLVLKNDKWVWEVLPDPGDQLGTMVQPSIVPENDPEGAKGWDKMTLNWDTIALSPSQLTVDYSYFNGPRINWYSLSGTRAEVHKGNYICHGIHYFYSGFRFKNTPTSDGKVESKGKDNTLFQEPCILQYNVQSKKWTVLIDFLIVGDPLEEPTVVGGPRPDPNTLLVTTGPRVYCRQAGVADNAWLEVQKEQLQLSSLPKRASLFALGEDLLYCDPRLPNPLSVPLFALNRYDIAPYFPKFLPALNPQAGYDPKLNPVGEQEPILDLHWSVLENSFTGYDQDLFCIVKLVSAVKPPGAGSPTTSEVSALAHFDGKRWQILPAGLGLLLPADSTFRRELMLDYTGALGPAIGATKIVLGGYPSDKPLLRRYVPVARWGSG